MEKIFLSIVIRARVLQLYYHSCHNLVTGPTFFSDHSFFNDSYDRLTEDYDSFAEQFISQFGKDKFKTKLINEMVEEELEKVPVETLSADNMFTIALTLEQEYQTDLTKLANKASLGLQNLIGDVCQQSDIRIYKMKQRTK